MKKRVDLLRYGDRVRVEERRLVKEISDIKKAGTEDVVKGVDRDER